MRELIIGKGRQVRVCMQVIDMDATDTALAIEAAGTLFVIIIGINFSVLSLRAWSLDSSFLI